ncbi:MAG TPA: FHA domain-containing protein [Acidimicrobiales bacterium]|nr:FHA domain-containing protein [Acidimicrobiales bacterium]
MPGPALRFLEYVFLALLYLFFFRVIRAVWVELREPRLVPASPRAAVMGPEPNGTGAPSAQPRDGAKRKASASRLVVVAPEHQKGTGYALADELTIGRASGCAVGLLEDNFVSQVHARVFRRGDDYWVEDLGSTNGTLLNGRRLTGPAPVRKGDRVQVGRTILELAR